MNKIRIIFIACLILLLSSSHTFSQGAYRIAVFLDDLPGHHPELALNLVSTLLDEGFDMQLINADAIINPATMNSQNIDMLMLPSAGYLPAKSMDTIHQFVKEGGDVMALSAPAFTQLAWKHNDQWLTENKWRKQLTKQPTEHVLFDFENQTLDGWTRHSNTPKAKTVNEIIKEDNDHVFHTHINQLAGWDTYSSPVLNNPFPVDHTLTTFYAKGVGETRTLSFEWKEKDGSRWIATFPVSNIWQRVVLTPHDFDYWESVPHRGGENDCFNPKNANQFQIGVAWTHTGPRGGEYEYYIDDIGTAPNPFGDFHPIQQNPPVIEGLSPHFKYYPLNDTAQLVPRRLLKLAKETVPHATHITSHHPRPTGKGYNKQRDQRWIRLIDATGWRNEWRGSPASLFVNFSGKYKNSQRATYSIQDWEWYQNSSVIQTIKQTIKQMARGVFFVEAGTEFFTYRPGQPVTIGATLANLSRNDLNELTLQFELTAKDESLPFKRVIQPVNLPAGQIGSITRAIRLPRQGDQFSINVQLIKDDIPIDQITHQIHIYNPKPKDQQSFVSVRDGNFYLDGKKWYVHGVNYMPSTGIALDNYPDFEFWLGRSAYDPEFIQRDLERCRDMGLNSVSIFIYHRSIEANNLIDFLHRCQELGLKVNLSIRPGTPMNYDQDWWDEILRQNQLWENDTIYAYDIAWEPFFGTVEQRRQYDWEWREWLVDQYGSIKKAENAWNYPAPLYSGKVSCPTFSHLSKDGPHRKMVADYRRFVDELVHAHYQAAADFLRRIDPNHLISFRMTVTGDPTYLGARKMPYDFRGVSRCMDFLSPEGYGRIGDWERIKPGMFTVSYARYCAPKKPVLWAEAGVHAWNNQTMQTDPERLEFQAEFYSNFYKMVLKSFSNGVVWWWYPGGFRYNEKSDYGIINPDGTDRPVTKVIRRYAEDILSKRTIPEPTDWIEIDRDADARGLYGIYDQVKERYWQIIEAGKVPGLRNNQ